MSLQLHMGALSDPETAKAPGRALRAIVPSCFVKVPFRPHEPHSLLIARDLEAEGIPVNFTSTFSARQVVAAALLADVTRTNVLALAEYHGKFDGVAIRARFRSGRSRTSCAWWRGRPASMR